MRSAFKIVMPLVAGTLGAAWVIAGPLVAIDFWRLNGRWLWDDFWVDEPLARVAGMILGLTLLCAWMALASFLLQWPARLILRWVKRLRPRDEPPQPPPSRERVPVGGGPRVPSPLTAHAAVPVADD